MPANDPRGTDSSPLVIQVKPPTKTPEETSKEQEQEQEQATDRWRTFGLGVLTALVLILQTIMIARQAHITTRQNQIMDRQTTIMNRQLAATEIAANATARSAKTQFIQMYWTLRARMGLKGVTYRNFGPNQPTIFRLVFGNSGGKGALLIDYFLTTTIGTLPAEPIYPENQWKLLGTPVEAGSEHTLALMLDPPIPDAIWAQINDERSGVRLKIYGVLRYNVGFGKKPVMVRFCREFDPQMTRYEGQPTFGTTGGKAYNRAD